MQSAPIAMMDSGVGGLTVLKTALRTFPQEQFLFLGDEQHLPYGEKSPTAVRAIVVQSVLFLSASRPN
ncbi:hypothetical protein [Fructilactobacillus florum]|uniref:hypothetical protein n=1 Tax=Fructilactobacillus florum TaxID=640331 RepID=UPI000AAD0233|nr:hypothetical protein [Fructilactobacillus florum]